MGKWNTTDNFSTSHCVYRDDTWFADTANSAHAQKIVDTLNRYEDLCDARDRLAAENARLEALVVAKNESIEVLYAKWSKEIVKRDAANATLDALRKAVPEKGGDNWCCACNRFVGIDYVQDYEDTIRKCDNCGSWHYDSSTDAADSLRAILYPKETKDT